MKHLISAAAIMISICVFCAVNTVHISHITDESSSFISSALDSAESGKWNEARQLCSQASQYWYDKSFYLSSVLHHDFSDDISEGIASLNALAKWQETADFAAQAAETISSLERIKQAELPLLRNIL